MADDYGLPYSCSAQDRPVKRQRSTMWGKNPMGIIVAKPETTPPHAKCNICSRAVIPGQRIIKDEQYGSPEMWWNHLECADLSMFLLDDEGVCTHPSTSTMTKDCAWSPSRSLLGCIKCMATGWGGHMPPVTSARCQTLSKYYAAYKRSTPSSKCQCSVIGGTHCSS